MAARDPKQADDDAVMALVAQAVLDDPKLSIERTMFAAMMRRLLELLAKEQARRPAHRPRAPVSIGRRVEILVEAISHTRSADQAEKLAIATVAKQRNLKPNTVARRYREHKAQQRGGK